MKKELKEKAFEMRRKGFSYRQIQTKLGIAKGTISGWFHNQPWSKKIKINLIKKMKPRWREHGHLLGLTRSRQWKKKREQSKDAAKKLFPKFFHEPLFIAGLMLYWGEGDNKGGSIVRIANIKPSIIKIFYRFLLRYCKVDKHRIRLSLVLYKEHNNLECKKYWSDKIGLPLDQFIKSQYIVGKSLKNRIPYGVATLYVTSCELKEKILKWIGLVECQLAKKRGNSSAG